MMSTWYVLVRYCGVWSDRLRNWYHLHSTCAATGKSSEVYKGELALSEVFQVVLLCSLILPWWNCNFLCHSGTERAASKRLRLEQQEDVHFLWTDSGHFLSLTRQDYTPAQCTPPPLFSNPVVLNLFWTSAPFISSWTSQHPLAYFLPLLKIGSMGPHFLPSSLFEVGVQKVPT